MEPTVRRVAGSDGLSLQLLEWSREGVPFLMVHGFGNEAHIWDDFAPAVAPYYRTLALDWRGHGESDWHPEGAYDYENLLADLEAVTDALELDRFVLVGHSLGGRVSTFYAGRHPERLAGLVIVDTGPEHDARGTLRISLDVEQHPNPSFASVAEYEVMLSESYPAATPTAIERMARYGVKQREDGRYVLRMDPRLRDFRGTETSEEREKREEATTAELWASLERITCPTLVVRGAASDILGPDVADKMVEEALGQGQLAVVGQAGHSVMTDNPQGFRDAVSVFALGEE